MCLQLKARCGISGTAPKIIVSRSTVEICIYMSKCMWLIRRTYHVYVHVWSPISTICVPFHTHAHTHTHTHIYIYICNLKIGNFRHIPMCVLRCLWVSTCLINVYSAWINLSIFILCGLNYHFKSEGSLYVLYALTGRQCEHISANVLNSTYPMI